MSFWAYMLHCRGGAFYVGHTDDLERRIAQHKSGTIPGFSSEHLPVELVWSQEFQTRDDAEAAERQLKGWSRSKNLALIRGDWDRISALAKGKSSPSTSSGKTGRGESDPLNSVHPELVEGLSFSLIPHPDAPPMGVRSITVACWMTYPDDILVQFTVHGCEFLRLPDWRTSTRQDNLWQSTCFEMFIKPAGHNNYFEFNLSPSTEWSAYSFESYREGMSGLVVAIPPHIECSAGPSTFELEADIDLGNIPPGDLIMGLSAVIEETGGTKSYWALAHPPGKPDFHHPACFAARLPAPGAP